MVLPERPASTPLFLNGTWQQLGQDIVDGNAADLYIPGSSVTLSQDGSVMAIGTPGHELTAEMNGHVRVFEYNTAALSWEQMGSDVTSEAQDVGLVYSLSLSSNGRRLAVGCRYHNAEKGTRFDRVRIYQFDDTISEWNQMTIDDKATVRLVSPCPCPVKDLSWLQVLRIMTMRLGL